MSYELYVTRRRHWFDEAGEPITPKEWHRLIEADPELFTASDMGDHVATWSGGSELDVP